MTDVPLGSVVGYDLCAFVSNVMLFVKQIIFNKFEVLFTRLSKPNHLLYRFG